MMIRLLFFIPLFPLVIAAWQPFAYGDVTGRYIRIEAPVSQRFGLDEIEAIHNGTNLLRDGRAVRFVGVGHRGRDINFRDEAQQLIDGDVDRSRRSLSLQTAAGVNPWVEVDLGASHSIDAIKLSYPAGTGYADRGRRLVTLLDADRRVVFARGFDVRDEDFKQSAHLPLEATPPPIGGRQVPQRAASWLPLAHVLEVADTQHLANASRTESFARRNEAPQIKAFADHFFRCIDLQKPELAEIARLYRSGQAQAALDAFRDHFLAKIANQESTWGHSLPRRSYAQQPDDLMNGVAVTFVHDQALAMNFTPGQIPWTFVPKDASEASDWRAAATERIVVNQLPRALLWKWAEGGEDEHLARWAAISDDWALHMTSEVEQSPHNLRQYFVKSPMQELNWFFVELSAVAEMRPELRDKLPSATLARVLLVALEEAGPAYWRQARKMVYNHTFNGLDAAYEASRVLDDFYAGQYLAHEVSRHFDRMWTFALTRDGSMIEVGDEGHLYMPLVTGRMYHRMQQDPPAWLTDAQRARFVAGYAMLSRYPIRHLAPGGYGHRFSLHSEAERIAALTKEVRTFKQGEAVPSHAALEIFQDDQVRAILDTVYGEGTAADDATASSPEIREHFVQFFAGPYRGAPEYRSDWMPFAGLHYLRGGWSADDWFVHMLGQPGRGEANGKHWNTEFRFHDFGHPLLRVEAIEVDRQKQDPLGDGLGQFPGSKTNRLTEASQKPMNARWLTSDWFDLAECFFEGPYRTRVKDAREQPQPVARGRLTRQVYQIRPLRLLLATDRVHLAGEPQQTHDFALPTVFHTTIQGRQSAPGEVLLDESNQSLQTRQDGAPNVRLWHASANPLSYTRSRLGAPRAPRSTRFPPDLKFVEQPLLVRWRGTGQDCLATLISAEQVGEPATVERVEQIADDEHIGFRAIAGGDASVEYRAARGQTATLSVGRLEADAESLLLVTLPNRTGGVALGVRRLLLDGEPVEVPCADFEFELTPAGLKVLQHVLRPIDPVEIGPAAQAFIGSTQVNMASATPDVEIFYTLDGSDPTRQSHRYQGPFELSATAHVRARAFRQGSLLQQAPFATAGVQVSAVSDAEFVRMQPLPARNVDRQELAPGLAYDYLESNWLRLFSHADRLPATASGTTAQLFDVSMRKTEGPFAVRYHGLLQVPQTSVYTFHAPQEFVRNIAAPGYDLRLWIDGREWRPSQIWHGLGGWSIPLEAGPHEFRLIFADARATEVATQRRDLWRDYPQPWVVWAGETPELEISSPHHPRQPIPNAWLLHDSTRPRAGEQAAKDDNP